MSEKYLTLSSFKYGLDTRREQLTSVPGTLVNLINGHIDAGGQIVQRASFIKDSVKFPDNCFGLQDTDEGLMVFGSDEFPASALPTGVTYQRLVPPKGFGDMIEVVFSCNYLGKAFVIALFEDEIPTLAYYDGDLVKATRNGLVVEADPGPGVESISDLAVDLTAQVNELEGWKAVANVDQTGAAQAGSVIITAPLGVQSALVPSWDSTAGIIGVQPVDQGVDGTAGVSAKASFLIGGASPGTVTVSAPYNADGTGLAVLANAIPWNTSAALTAHDVAVAIRANAALFNYSAAADALGNVTVYTPVRFGNVGFNLTVVTTGSVTQAAGSPTGGFNASVDPTNVIVQRFVGVGNGSIVSGTATVGITGANGSVTYLWEEVDQNGNTFGGAGSGIAMTSSTTPSVGFSKVLQSSSQGGETSIIGFFHVKVTDAGPPAKTVTIRFFVKFSVITVGF